MVGVVMFASILPDIGRLEDGKTRNRVVPPNAHRTPSFHNATRFDPRIFEERNNHSFSQETGIRVSNR